MRDDQAGPPAAQYQPTMQAGAAQPVGVLLHAPRGRRRHAGDDERDRSVVHQISVLRQPPDRSLSASGRGRHRTASCKAVDGEDGFGGNHKRPRTSQPHPQHPVFPYLLRKMQIDRPNQVWCADITFVPVKNGFLYLVAIMDWATRRVLSWRLSNTMHADFCVDALNEAVAKHGPPEIMNTDQGSQFTGSAWITTLSEAGVRISMDGRGRYLDNIFIERLWRSLKQEAIYLEEINDGFKARRVVKDWMAFYNTNRPHSALDRRTPDEAYLKGREEQKAA